MKPEKLNPSQLLEKEEADLEKLFTEPSKIPEKIGKYQILEEIGRGGMGCVYKVFDANMDKFIALKIVLSGAMAKEIERQRFLREAQALAKMNHPNIVKVYTIGKEQNVPYFTMDYIEGISLKQFLKNTPLDIKKFSLLMEKISRAMAYAHKQGIVHRDLKPSNIIIDKNNEPQIMDFGLAKLAKVDKSLSEKGAVIGTPKYMSPEQASGGKVSPLTDVYALGAIFYEMLSGKTLVQGQTVTEIIFKITNREPDLLRKVNNGFLKI